MRTGLTKQEKTTDIWFDEKDALIHPCGRVRSAEGLSPHRDFTPRSDMAALPQTGEATLPLRQLVLSTPLCTCGKRTPCVASYSLSTSLIILSGR